MQVAHFLVETFLAEILVEVLDCLADEEPRPIHPDVLHVEALILGGEKSNCAMGQAGFVPGVGNLTTN